MGYQAIKQKKEPNFIQVPFGNGSLLLHTQPAVFSNFHLLKEDHYEYTRSITVLYSKG